MSEDRNMLIRAYRGAGRDYLASKFVLLFSTEDEIVRHSHPAIRDDVAKAMHLLLKEEGIVRLCAEMAERALGMMTEDEGESKNA